MQYRGPYQHACKLWVQVVRASALHLEMTADKSADITKCSLGRMVWSHVGW